MAKFTKSAKTVEDVDRARTAAAQLTSVAAEAGGGSSPALSVVPSVAPGPDFGARQNPTSGYVIGQVAEVPLDLIKSNPVGPRIIYPLSEVEDLARKMERDGQLMSATAFINAAGQVVLIEGETRLRAAGVNRWKTLRIEFQAEPEGERSLYEKARSANKDRREHSPLDDGLRWRDLLDRKVYSNQSDLAKALDIGNDIVSRSLSLTAIPMKVLTVISEHPPLLTLRMLNAIREFFELKGEDETIDMVHKAARESLGYRDVENLRKAAEKPPEKRPRSEKEPFTFGGIRGELRVFTEEGRVELSIKGLAGDAAASLQQKLKAALAS